MTKSITVNSSIDDSTKLQKLIDANGNTPAIFNFQGDELEINSLIRFFNFAEVAGNGITFRLMDNAPVGTFGVQVPLVSSKYLKGVEGLTFRNFKFRGNYLNQKPANKASGSDHGDGYHNQIGFGNMSDPQYGNVVNCLFEDLDMGYSYGDQIRINGGSNLTFKNITCNMGGHDIIHLSAVKDSEVVGLKAPNIRTNNAVRTRNCTNIEVHNCEVSYGTGYDTGPAFQSECITPNRTSSKIRYHDNVIKGLKGAAFYIVADQPADDIQIYNNLIIECGQLEKAIKHPNVGGATILGWTNAKFYNNTVVGCRGYGVSDTTFAYKSSRKGDIEVYRNIFTGMKEAYYPGTASGTAIAHLSGSQTTMAAWENCLYDNVRDLYNVVNTNGILKDPRFTEDYHLKEDSPCRFDGYQLGCYTDSTETPEEPEAPSEETTSLFISCAPPEADLITSKYSQLYKIYRSN